MTLGAVRGGAGPTSNATLLDGLIEEKLLDALASCKISLPSVYVAGSGADSKHSTAAAHIPCKGMSKTKWLGLWP